MPIKEIQISYRYDKWDEAKAKDALLCYSIKNNYNFIMFKPLQEIYDIGEDCVVFRLVALVENNT